MPQIPLPMHLKHQPVFAIPYFEYDGRYAGNTDCQHLSIGWAQYDSHALSAKIFRNPDDRWSRQSEEMPLHRVVDLATLIALALENHDKNTLPLPAEFLENQKDEQKISRVDEPLKMDAFSRELTGDHVLRRRLSKLADVLGDLRQKRII